MSHVTTPHLIVKGHTTTTEILHLQSGDSAPSRISRRDIRGPSTVRYIRHHGDGGVNVRVGDLESVAVTVPARWWDDVTDRGAHAPAHEDDAHLVVWPDQITYRRRGGPATLRLTVPQAQNLRDDATHLVVDTDRSTVPAALITAARRAQVALMIALGDALD